MQQWSTSAPASSIRSHPTRDTNAVVFSACTLYAPKEVPREVSTSPPLQFMKNVSHMGVLCISLFVAGCCCHLNIYLKQCRLQELVPLWEIPVGKQTKWIVLFCNTDLQYSDSHKPQNRYYGGCKLIFVPWNAELLQGLLKPLVYLKVFVSKNTAGQPYWLQQWVT